MSVQRHDRFSGLASTYQQHRPSYPPALFDWLLGLFAPERPARVLDVGCGTGIATRLLAARGLDVAGVDPNFDMLREAASLGGRYVRAGAEALPFAAASVDLVTVAQAFHWLDADAALAEFARVLRPRGWCCAWWNDRASWPFPDAYERLLRAHSEDFVRRYRGAEARLEGRRVRDVVKAGFPNTQVLDHDAYLGRVESDSYVRNGLARREEFFREIEALFARHERSGKIEIVYETRAIAWRPAV